VLDFRILGPLEVTTESGPLPLGGQKPRAVLALLLVHAGEVVSTDRLIDELWGEQPPKTATTSLQNTVSQLRKLLGPEVLSTRPPGYALAVDKAQIDSHRFERLLERAKSAEAAERSRLLREALALWRGPPLGDFAFEAFAQNETRRLEELRLVALEDRIAADLDTGRHGDLAGELEGLVAEHPLRERFRGQLMLALYRSGRQAEALQAYHDARRALVDELGIEPSSALQQLHASILRQESGLEPAGAPRASEDHLGEVVRAVLAGRLVAVLGPGALLEQLTRDEDDLASHLAEAFGCPPEHRGGLTRVSQYIAVTKGIGPLYDELHGLFVREVEPTAVHRFLARLPALLRERQAPHPVIVTTGYDHTLDRAFGEVGEEFDVVCYAAAGRDRGRFIHRRPDGSETVIDVPNAYAELAPERRPVILKIHGEADRRPDRARESFVVSEDDYIAYLARTELANVVPVTLAAKLLRSHFLFLGYPLVEWNLRVFLHRVFGDEPISYRSWAVEPSAEPIRREFWRRRDVDVLEAPLDEYVGELERRVREATVAVPAR
jgi:DNA-binding SARP family transcriptional activator